LHHRTDIDDWRVSGDQRLSRRLAAAEEDNLGIEAIFLK
jgi:hypothetical protein